jgi:hypothetical protein
VSRGDRRSAMRRAPAPADALARVRLRTGRELGVIDIGNGGALVEGEGRLLPGTHVDVHVMTRDGRALVRSRVVRAFVSDLTADRIVYRGALAFERPVDTSPGYGVPSLPASALDAVGTGYPAEHA